MLSLGKKTKTPLDIPPIDEQPEYRSKLDALERLKSQLREVQADIDKLIAMHNSVSTSKARNGLDPLVENYLQGGQAAIDMRTREEQLSTLKRQYRALYQAIELTERDLGALRLELSTRTAAQQRDRFRAHARVVLLGMLTVQRGNQAIEELCQMRKDGGYTEYFHAVGMPWPQWGRTIIEEHSTWHMILREFLEMEIISGAEHHRLINGYMEFEP